MRVIHVGPDTAARGGIASVLSNLAAHQLQFAQLGYEFAFLATTPARSTGYFRRALPFVRSVAQLVLKILRRDVDVVHLHTATRGSLARKSILAFVCASLRMPYVLHIHNGAFLQYYRTRSVFGRLWVRQTLRGSAGIVVLTPPSLDALCEEGLAKRGACHVVYNGIADPLAGKSCVKYGPRPVIVTFLGLVSAAKGAPQLVSAVARMKPDLPPFVVQFGGIGDIEGLLETIDDHELNSVVRYLGWLEGRAKAAALEETDIFVLPSRSEGFSVAIVEAMAHGIAIVSTAIPGVIEAIRNGLDGVLVEPDEIATLSQALERLILDPDERARLGMSARQRYLATFTMDQMAMRLAQVYDAVRAGHLESSREKD